MRIWIFIVMFRNKLNFAWRRLLNKIGYSNYYNLCLVTTLDPYLSASESQINQWWWINCSLPRVKRIYLLFVVVLLTARSSQCIRNKARYKIEAHMEISIEQKLHSQRYCQLFPNLSKVVLGYTKGHLERWLGPQYN